MILSCVVVLVCFSQVALPSLVRSFIASRLLYCHDTRDLKYVVLAPMGGLVQVIAARQYWSLLCRHLALQKVHIKATIVNFFIQISREQNLACTPHFMHSSKKLERLLVQELNVQPILLFLFGFSLVSLWNQVLLNKFLQLTYFLQHIISFIGVLSYLRTLVWFILLDLQMSSMGETSGHLVHSVLTLSFLTERSLKNAQLENCQTCILHKHNFFTVIKIRLIFVFHGL